MVSPSGRIIQSRTVADQHYFFSHFGFIKDEDTRAGTFVGQKPYSLLSMVQVRERDGPIMETSELDAILDDCSTKGLPKSAEDGRQELLKGVLSGLRDFNSVYVYTLKRIS